MSDSKDVTDSGKSTAQSSRKLSMREKIAYGLGSANDAWGNWFLVGAVWQMLPQS